jgi:hypothetical protein
MSIRRNVTLLLSLLGQLNAEVIRRQSGPVDPSTDPDCSFFDTSFSSDDNCAFFESNWGISHTNFVAWVCESEICLGQS